MCGETRGQEFNGGFESLYSLSEAYQPARDAAGAEASKPWHYLRASPTIFFLFSAILSHYSPCDLHTPLRSRRHSSLCRLDCAYLDSQIRMPPIRSSRNRKPPPDGFEDIEDTLLEFSNKLKDAENASHEGKKKHEMVWPVFQITHQRT